MSNTQATNYINGYHPSVLKAHNQRTAQNSCQFLLPSLHNLASKNSSFKLLDAGCGPGSITISLAQLFPSSQITALDISDDALKPARESGAAQGAQNITFTPGDVYKLPFEDNTFDAVHAQQLLCHLPDATAAIKEMLRVTKSGGIIGLREGDLGGIIFYPELPQLHKCFRLLATQMDSERVTGNAHAGRKLRSWVRAAGITDEEVKTTAGTWNYSSDIDRQAFGEAWMDRVTKSAFPTQMMEQGLATREEMEEIREGWKQWKDDPDGWLCIPHGEALIIVP